MQFTKERKKVNLSSYFTEELFFSHDSPPKKQQINFQNFLMHLFQVAFFCSGALYALLEAPSLLLYFFAVIGIYFSFSILLPGGEKLSNRAKLISSSWPDTQDNSIFLKLPVRVEKVESIIKKSYLSGKKEPKLSMTHFVIKACGEVIRHAKDINGSYAFGRFYPNKQINITCNIDIGSGEQLATTTVFNTDKKSVREIAEFINEKAKEIKENKGDEDHKKRMKPVQFLPACLVGAIMGILSFVLNKLRISIPQLGIDRDHFGTALVTSVGMFGFKDANGPPTPLSGVFIVTVNAVSDVPVVENGELKIGRVMNINTRFDHRYIVGARAKHFTTVFENVFENPEQFLDSA